MLAFGIVNRVPPVSDFRKEECVMHVPFRGHFHASQGHPGCLTPRINFQRDRLEDTCFDASVTQPDGERLDAMHHGSPSRQQLPGAFGGAGHQCFLLLIQDKDHSYLPFPCGTS
jgi:hypothetical protein